MAGGDYLHVQSLEIKEIVDRTVLAATDYTTANQLIAARDANHTIFVQKIVVSITTYAAKTWTFQDDESTAVLIAFLSVKSAATAEVSESGTVTWDFGPYGTPLTEGADLDIIMSATGVAGRIHIEAYHKPTAASIDSGIN